MATITFKARVRKDGSLSLPAEARERLRLQPGDQVEIQIRTAEVGREQPSRNPLYDLIGIVKEGPADGAENHDAYLYGKKPS